MPRSRFFQPTHSLKLPGVPAWPVSIPAINVSLRKAAQHRVGINRLHLFGHFDDDLFGHNPGNLHFFTLLHDGFSHNTGDFDRFGDDTGHLNGRGGGAGDEQQHGSQ